MRFYYRAWRRNSLDTAKAVAAMAVLPGKLSDFAGKEMSGDFAPLVLIPTTAGTGSEATKFFVYTDTATDAKLLMKGDALLPKLAVIDWTYTISSPVSITERPLAIIDAQKRPAAIIVVPLIPKFFIVQFPPLV